MLKVHLRQPDTPLRRLLCLGAHCDDIEIGCGGTILRLLKEHPALQVTWVVFSSNKQRRREANRSAHLFLNNSKRHKIIVKSYRDSFFPYQGSRIKEFFEVLKSEPRPDLIFTHFRDDLHQDHRLISDLTWNAFRNHLILEYEIPKYDGDLGSPNLFAALEKAVLAKKIRLLLEAFQSQTKKHWFTEDTFRALPRIRGIESNAPEKYAEAFYCRKAIL